MVDGSGNPTRGMNFWHQDTACYRLYSGEAESEWDKQINRRRDDIEDAKTMLSVISSINGKGITAKEIMNFFKILRGQDYKYATGQIYLQFFSCFHVMKSFTIIEMTINSK